jgi:hypothetical protein
MCSGLSRIDRTAAGANPYVEGNADPLSAFSWVRSTDSADINVCVVEPRFADSDVLPAGNPAQVNLDGMTHA